MVGNLGRVADTNAAHFDTVAKETAEIVVDCDGVEPPKRARRKWERRAASTGARSSVMPKTMLQTNCHFHWRLVAIPAYAVCRNQVIYPYWSDVNVYYF